MKLMKFNSGELHSISRNSLIIHWPIDVNFSKWTMNCILKEQWNQIFLKCVRRGDLYPGSYESLCNNMSIWIFMNCFGMLVREQASFHVLVYP